MSKFVDQVKKIWNDINMVQKFLVFFAAMFFLCVMFNGDDTSADEEAVLMMEYCENTELFINSDLPLNDRPGWPPFKGREFCK